MACGECPSCEEGHTERCRSEGKIDQPPSPQLTDLLAWYENKKYDIWMDPDITEERRKEMLRTLNEQFNEKYSKFEVK